MIGFIINFIRSANPPRKKAFSMSVLKHHFKKILPAALCLLFIFSLTVPLFAAGGNEINFYGEKKFVCDKTFYNHLSFSPEGTIVFCGKSSAVYSSHTTVIFSFSRILFVI